MNELIKDLAALVLIHDDKIQVMAEIIDLQQRRIEGLTDLVERSAKLAVEMSKTAMAQKRELQDLKELVSRPPYSPMEN